MATSKNQKNRFSILLESLLHLANLKNITLAKELQYDESYISKWLSGKNLPPEQKLESILHGISNCITNSLTEDTKTVFFERYQLKNLADLNMAIYDDLYEEYFYVRSLKLETGKEIAPQSAYYPELPLTQFIQKLHHPSLRSVSALEVTAMWDILALDNDYRLSMATFQNAQLVQNYYPGVSFSCIIYLNNNTVTHFNDAIFLMNMLTTLSNIQFQLYAHEAAFGKLLFTVKDSFSITGMLLDSNHCISVNVNEEADSCNLLYHRIHSLCTPDTLLFRNTTIKEMIAKHEYEQSMLSSNLRCILGHLTEHFLSDDLHDELTDQYVPNSTVQKQLKRLRRITTQVAKNSPIQIIIHANALQEFAISGELDFYNHKITLSPEQRLHYMTSLIEMFTSYDNLQIKLLVGDMNSSFHHVPKATLFLSNSIGYLRLFKYGKNNNITIISKENIKTVFNNFYDTLWTKSSIYGLKDEFEVMQYIQECIQTIHILLKLPENIDL